MQLGAINAIVSVVIPCLDEEEPIAGVVREVLAQGVDEVIVVDNGSRDATAARARDAGARVISEPRRGYGLRVRRRRRRGPCRCADRVLPGWRRQRRAGISRAPSYPRSRVQKPISSWARACAAIASPAA